METTFARVPGKEELQAYRERVVEALGSAAAELYDRASENMFTPNGPESLAAWRAASVPAEGHLDPLSTLPAYLREHPAV